MQTGSGDKYIKWVAENFPAELERIKALWSERQDLQRRIQEIEHELLKYAPSIPE